MRAQVDPNRTTLWIGEGGDSSPRTGTITYLPTFDALHLYSVAWDADPGRALAARAQRTRGVPGNKLWVATVMPGGDYADVRPRGKYRERENGAFFERAWRGALATNPDMVILTSLNEENERSDIHPRSDWGDPNLYVDINRRYGDMYRALRGDVPPAPTVVPPGGQPTPIAVTVVPPAPGTSKTVASIKSDTPTSLSLTLPTGQQAGVTVGGNVLGALQAAQPKVSTADVAFDVAPVPVKPVEVALYGGGQIVLAGDPVDIKVELRDAAGNQVGAASDVADAIVEITLPLQPPAEPGARFHWLHEVYEDGEVLGWAWSKEEIRDEVAGTILIPLSVAELQGTLFLPVSILPGFVQNHDPMVHVWSGPTRLAVDFGFAGPQFTTFSVVAPQVGLRIFVYSPVVDNYAWIDAPGVGPSGPPGSTRCWWCGGDDKRGGRCDHGG